MVQVAKKGFRKGMKDTFFNQSQLNTQAAAVTAVAYTASGAIADDDAVCTVATNSTAYTIAGNVMWVEY